MPHPAHVRSAYLAYVPLNAVVVHSDTLLVDVPHSCLVSGKHSDHSDLPNIPNCVDHTFSDHLGISQNDTPYSVAP